MLSKAKHPMRQRFFASLRMTFLCAFCILLVSLPALAEGDHTIALQVLPLEPFKAGHEQHAVAKLTHLIDGSPVLANELATSHTKKFHLLIIDEALDDFQHVHPDMHDISHADCPKWYNCNPGEYPFVWTPRHDAHYRAWADITPADSGKQEYAMAEMPHEAKPGQAEGNFATRDEALSGRFHFTLTTAEPLIAGKSAILHLHVADAKGHSLCNGDHPCSILEPVLGAFAHVAGFNEDFETVIHAHPMGAEPEDNDSRSVPDLDIHILPPKPGFYRVFVQLGMMGKSYFVPFGIDVKNAAGEVSHVIKNP